MITNTEPLIRTDHYVFIRSNELLLEGIHHNQSYIILRMKPIESTAHMIERNPKRPFKYEKLQEIEEPDKIKYLPDEFM